MRNTMRSESMGCRIRLDFRAEDGDCLSVSGWFCCARREIGSTLKCDEKDEKEDWIFRSNGAGWTGTFIHSLLHG